MTSKMTRKIYRQGDVLFVEAKAKRDLPVIAPDDRGRNVLAHGEVTGHAHVMERDAAILLGANPTSPSQLKVLSASALTHEEHTAITIDVGLFDLPKQVEEFSTAIRRVED